MRRGLRDFRTPSALSVQQPCRGLQADYLGDRVYILDTYNRRGKLQADVAPIRPGRQPGKFVLGTNKNASGSDLANPGRAAEHSEWRRDTYVQT